MNANIATYDLRSDEISDFASTLKEFFGVDANVCFQCRKCVSGCPITEYIDLSPTQLIHGICLGLKDLVLQSKTYWICIACGTCTDRCPQGIGLLKVKDALANIAIRANIKSKEPAITEFYKVGLGAINIFGSMYEAGIASIVTIITGNLKRDIGTGLRLLRKGKMDLLPRFQRSQEIKRLFKAVKKKYLKGIEQ